MEVPKFAGVRQQVKQRLVDWTDMVVLVWILWVVAQRQKNALPSASPTKLLSSHAEHILKRFHDLHGMHSRHQQVFTKFLTNEKNHQKTRRRGRKHVVFADTTKNEDQKKKQN